MESVAATLPQTPDVAPRANLSALLLDAGVGDTDSDSNDFKTRRKRALGSSSSANQEITRTYARGASTSRSTPTSDAFEAQGMLLGRVHLMADTVGLAEAEEERDENLYCFCQRGSFGEMIGCDSDDCKYEWVCQCWLILLMQFHIGCVGVSKPLPQTWLCSDCLAKNKKRRRA